MAALAQASSLSPPGAPETPRAPISSPPAIRGMPPAQVISLGSFLIRSARAGSVLALSPTTPEGWLNVMVVKALRRPTAPVMSGAPSAEICTRGAPAEFTTTAVTL